MFIKKVILAVFSLCSFPALAQQNFFLQPVLGIGMGKTTPLQSLSSKQKTQFTLLYNAQIGIGYESGRFVLNTGLGYTQTGLALDFQYTDGLGEPIGDGSLSIHYNNLVVPFTAGYKFLMGKKSSVSPLVGAELSYLFSGTSVQSGFGAIHRQKINAAEIKREFQPIGLTGIVQLNFVFKVTDRISIVVAPGFDYLLTNMNKAETGQSLHTYAIRLNGGIKWRL